MTSLPRVLTAADLRELRVGNGVSERKVRSGHWQRGARGVVLTSNDPPTASDLVEIARAHVAGEFVVTGLLVLAELGLPWLPPIRKAHVLVPPEIRRRGGDLVRVSRVNSYSELRTWQRYDALLATADRAVIDAARAESSLREARGIVLGAVSHNMVTPAGLHVLLDAGQRNGSALTRRAIRDAERGCASPPEAELVDALIGKGVPFYVNPKIYLGELLLGSTDVWLVGLGMGGEVESVEWHGNDEQTESTYDRHERITTPGIELVHLGVRRIRTDAEEAVGHLLRRADERRGLSPHEREPAGLRVVPRGPLLR